MSTLKKITSVLMLVCIAQVSIAQRFLNEVFTDAEIVTTNNVVYSSNYNFLSDPDGIIGNQTMRVYQPSQSVDQVDARPVIIYLHTGNFLPPGINGAPTGANNDSSALELCKQWAKRGYVAVAPAYRLGWNPLSTDPEVRRATLLNAVYRALQDVKASVRFLRKDAATTNTYKIDPNRIVVYGEGTGGYVALAYGTLTDYVKLFVQKFIVPGSNPARTYVDTLLSGNIEGFGGSKNVDNHTGYSSEVNMIVNAGGALADTLWIEDKQVPVVSFHCVRDPFAPYGNGTVVVPTTNEDVVPVSGAGVFINQVANKFGNNCAFDTMPGTDPYTTVARSRYNQSVSFVNPATINTGTGEGLFPIIRPLNATILNNEAGPWQWWDLNHPNSASSLQSNPDMSRAKALSYIDTIQGYALPRVYRVLNLGDLSASPNYCNKEVIQSVFNSTKQDVSLSMYPNPSNGSLFIELSGIKYEISKVQVFDITGKIVAVENVSKGTNYYEMQNKNLNAGVYFVNVHLNDGSQATRRIIFE